MSLSDKAVVEIRSGSDWEQATREAIFAFIVANGGVPPSPALATNLQEAHRLALLRANNEIVAVGAIKKPRISYVQRLSTKSGFDLSKYKAELGYIAVRCPDRGKGVAPFICDRLLDGLDELLFATTGSGRMKVVLEERGFIQSGKSWSAREGAAVDRLTLFVRD